MNGRIHNWIGAFLTQRTRQVVVEGDHSSTVKVDSGVPQGTVLGLLMFLCFINDLPDHVISTVRLFADDCMFYKQIRNHNDQIDLQMDLCTLENWAKTWGMLSNAKQCYVMSSLKSQTNVHLRIHWHNLGPLPSQRHWQARGNSTTSSQIYR